VFSSLVNNRLVTNVMSLRCIGHRDMLSMFVTGRLPSSITTLLDDQLYSPLLLDDQLYSPLLLPTHGEYYDVGTATTMNLLDHRISMRVTLLSITPACPPMVNTIKCQEPSSLTTSPTTTSTTICVYFGLQHPGLHRTHGNKPTAAGISYRNKNTFYSVLARFKRRNVSTSYLV